MGAMVDGPWDRGEGGADSPEAPWDKPASALSALEMAGKIGQLLDQKADPSRIVQAYSAFERAYPQASLPGEAQFRVAWLLARRQRRLLAIEAFRKVVRNAREEGKMTIAARLALARLLGRSSETFSEALRTLEQVRALTREKQHLALARAMERRIRSALDEIYPRSPAGEPGRRPQGNCRILAQTASKIPVPDVGGLLAARLGLRPLDVNIALARSPGILARDAPPDVADGLAHELQAMGIPVVVLAEDRCPSLPSAELATSIQTVKSGAYRLELPGGPFDLAPSRLALAQFAALRSVDWVSREAPRRPSIEGIAVGAKGAGFGRRTRVQRLCDLYLCDPLKRLRLVERRTQPTGLAPLSPAASPAAFQALVKEILGKAGQLPVNRSLDLLFSDGDLASITYDSPQALDNHAEWLFLLAFNGVVGE